MATNDIPESCPSCKADFRGEPIPKNDREYFGNAERFLRVIGIYDGTRDRTTQWKCPDCGYIWERKPQ
jgi:rubrerythrin